MKAFLDTSFLLENGTAEKLYFDYAAPMPIIDYHNHLSPKYIARDHHFANITQAWLAGDHYKWRAMRIHGIEEKFITGEAEDDEKFLKWATTVPYTVRNPLYHWTHLELQRYFNISLLLNETTGPGIYSETSAILRKPEWGCQGLLKKMNVEVVCTTDDPIDDLQFHHDMQDESLRMLPAFRPDKIFSIDDPKRFNAYVNALEASSNVAIQTLDDLISALAQRISYFHDRGCRLSDHGLAQLYSLEKVTRSADDIFSAARNGQNLATAEHQHFIMTVLVELCKLYHEKGWIQQFHLGALRNNNRRMMAQTGPDAGFDSIGDFPQAITLSAFLDHLDSSDQLAKTILYNLNPGDNEVMATMAGNFNDGSVPGKVQFGSAWWFLDQKDGMENQLNTLSNMGLLSRFIGMLTDSRSFLSFPRHEYFRRILCNLLGKEVEKGELPNDLPLLGTMVQNICYYNAKEYFSF